MTHMIKLSVAFAALILLSTYNANAQSIVFENTTGNDLQLHVQNESATFPLPGVTVEVTSSPSWLTFGTTSATVGDIAPSATKMASFSFDVADNTAGNTGTVKLKITATSGDEFTGVDDPNLDVDIKVFDGGAVAYVLDRSGSMGGAPLANAKSAANQGITTMDIGDEVAVVSFSSSAGTNYSLRLITDDTVRQGARAAVNGLSAGGATSIGAGLLAACGQLTNANSTQRNYVLLSDGMQNTPPTPEDALNSPCFQNLSSTPESAAKTGGAPFTEESTLEQSFSTTARVVQRVHTIAFGTGADQQLLLDIANQTGGIFLFLPTRNDPLALADLFLTIQAEITGDQRIGSEIGSISAPAEQTFPFLVGADIMEKTITLTWDDINDDLDLELEKPDGTLITAANWQSFSGFNRVEGPGIEYFTVNGPDTGTWTAHVKAVSGSADFALVFSGQSVIEMDIAFDKDAYFPGTPIGISAALTEEDAPITGAMVSAEVAVPTTAMAALMQQRGDAEIPNFNDLNIRPSEDGRSYVDEDGTVLLITADLTLFDDGAHGDGSANDGVYANFFTDTSVEGSYTFRVTADGTSPGSVLFTREAAKSTVVTVTANAPPGADAGPDQTVECTGPDGATVTLDGTGSSDPNGDPITFTWRENGAIIAGPTSDPMVNVTLALGAHTIELTVDDGIAGVDTDMVDVTIEDTTPPLVEVKSRKRLWPPDRTHRKLKLAKFSRASDICDATLSDDSMVITSVTSDEPQTGADQTLPDIVINDNCRKVKLLAEREEKGNGRVYTIHLGVLDASGNMGTATYQAYVPITKKGGAIDDGPVLTVAGCTPAPAPLAKVQTLGVDTLAVSKAIEAVPTEFVLEQNYPNPFNPVSTIAFALPESRRVTLVVYDVLGRRIDTLVDRKMEAGRYEVTWDASRLPSGVYLYRITAGDFVQVKQMILIK